MNSTAAAAQQGCAGGAECCQAVQHHSVQASFCQLKRLGKEEALQHPFGAQSFEVLSTRATTQEGSAMCAPSPGTALIPPPGPDHVDTAGVGMVEPRVRNRVQGPEQETDVITAH